MPLQFKKAVKYDARGRVALVGPPGSGKSYTALILARQLAGPQGKIAAVDTEHGSLSKYADLFDFDVIELDSFSPENFMAAITAAEQGKYDVFCCDSLSHFWTGKDGALEFVDMASKRHKDQMGGWKDFRPHERAMVDRMVASPCHVIVTMRTRTEYADQVDERTGKKKRVKIGLQPVQREGLEYEFDLVGYMDEDNAFIVDKTRCPFYSAKTITRPADRDFEPFSEWLKGVERDRQAADSSNSAGHVPPTTSSTQQKKPTANKNGAVQSNQVAPDGIDAKPGQAGGTTVKSPTAPPAGLSSAELKTILASLRNEYGHIGQVELYDHILKLHSDGADKPPTLKAARQCVAEMESILERAKQEAAQEVSQ
jgi:hypothetical protein